MNAAIHSIIGAVTNFKIDMVGVNSPVSTGITYPTISGLQNIVQPNDAKSNGTVDKYTTPESAVVGGNNTSITHAVSIVEMMQAKSEQSGAPDIVGMPGTNITPKNISPIEVLINHQLEIAEEQYYNQTIPFATTAAFVGIGLIYMYNSDFRPQWKRNL